MKNPRLSAPMLALALVTLLSDARAEIRTEEVKFAKGKSSAVVTGRISGDEAKLYTLKAKAGQFLKVTLRSDNPSTDFNVYVPGRGPGDEALFISATGGLEYLGQLEQSGAHSVSVFLNRTAARRGEAAKFDIAFSITNQAPGAAEEKPATGPVPQKVIDDCLVALRKLVGQEVGMKVLSAKRGEASFIIEVKVESAEKPWRCFHDGTQCTGTEYQGEG